MNFPLLILIILVSAAILAAVSAVYLVLYRRNANRALAADGGLVRRMAPPFKVVIVTAAVILIVAVVISYFAGYKTAYDRMEGAGADVGGALGNTFYGEIMGISEAENVWYLQVRGLDVNDINFRGDFTMSIYPETILEWRYTRIELSDLQVGDRVSITFRGAVQESDPAGIQEVVRVQLLDDWK